MNLTLTQSGQNVTGSGTIAGVASTVTLSTTGTFTNASFALTMSSPGLSDFDYTGTVSGNGSMMTGELNRSGFNHVTMELARQ